MYLVMNDKSFIGTRGGKIEKGILRYVEIPNDLLEQLDLRFIHNLKTILKMNQFSNIKHRKREPKINKNEFELELMDWIKKDINLIPNLDYSIWNKDIKKISKYFRKKEFQDFKYVKK